MLYKRRGTSSDMHISVKSMALIASDLCVSAGTCLDCMQAPSGSPSDVSRRLLDMCDVMDACEGVNIQTVMAAAMWEMKSSGSPGERRLLALEFQGRNCLRYCKFIGCIMSGNGVPGKGGGWTSRRQVKRAGTGLVKRDAQGVMVFVCTTASLASWP